MNGKNLIKIYFWIVCCFGLLSGCERWAYESGRTKRLWSSDQGFPNREIVFKIPGETENDIFGFIRPDGSGLITRSIAPELFANLPTWGPDGKFIAFRAQGLGGDNYFDAMRPRVISSEGETVGWCYDWGVGTGRIWITSEKQLLFAQYRGDGESERVMLGDFRSCQMLSTLYEASSVSGSAEKLKGLALSTQGWLAINRVFWKGEGRATAEIVVVNPNSQKQQIVGHGMAPAWSYDGEWLAYAAIDGIYIVRKDGTQARKIVNLDSRSESYPGTSEGMGWYVGLPAPSWSPDGNWLVYDRTTSTGPVIYKVNVKSGTETEIFRGGIYPDWRWDLDLANE